MTYSPYEEDRNAGLPIELYRFDFGVGSTDFVAYAANMDRVVVVGGVTYQPVQVQADAIKSEAARRQELLIIAVPASSQIVRQFDIYPPDAQIRVTISEYHYDDADADVEVVWTGTVLSCRPMMGDGSAELVCRPLVAATRQAGLRETYQYGCPYVLYGPRCNASKPARSVTALVSSVSGNRVVLASNWHDPFPVEKFFNGPLEWDINGNIRHRTIRGIDIDSRTLTLSGYPTGLGVGSLVTAACGCNHLMSDCRDLHENILNFGGCPWIPLENPINTNPFY